MELYFLEPEVGGGWGEQTNLGKSDNSVDSNVPHVQFLHYEFSGWLGDDILETTPCFIVSQDLQTTLLCSSLNGYTLEECLVTSSSEFEELCPGKTLPKFKRLIPLGTVNVYGTKFSGWSGHDFSLSQRAELVVTSKALEILRQRNLNYCEVTPLRQ